MHRWLLLLYPRDYRRERGAEILDTVRDLASTRAGVRVAANLARHGLRTRLGRPASRSVTSLATIFTLACALFAASFGTWLAWSGTRPLDHDAFAATVHQLYPDGPGLEIEQADPLAVFIIFGQPLSWQAVPDLLFGDGNEYALATVTASVRRPPTDSLPQALATLQQRLQDAGWEYAEPLYANLYDCIPGYPQCDPAAIPQNITFSARRGDDILEVEISADTSYPAIRLAMSRATPWTAHIAGAAAFLIGALAAWWLFGWASRRIERGHRAAQGLAKVLFVSAMLLWWPPILLSAPLSLGHHLSEPHYRWHPMWEWLGQPTFSLFFLLGCALLTLALGLAALRRQPADRALAVG
ncbi:hypothetical protein F4553_000667 [Allocatelliglobosispora scoriae]|uniref:Uncharacterized protein n=1 Tax=Allocatelliglobosispora scoriae TaxID=643052 RepID=A0A841BIY7_9ACTN|nr:hypothetical protein [Allocatelliglobosispora scoriae]MBB5867288.1 hypothetical protein [Allocatelliglobosispora scoriae]